MLQIYNSPSDQVREGGSLHDAPSATDASLAELFTTAIGFIRRQWTTVLLFVPFTIALAAAYLITTPPFYSAKAKIMIDTGRVQLFKQSILGDDPVTSAMVDSELEILKSENFALSVIKNLQLTQDPEFVGSGGGLMSSAMSMLLNPFSAASRLLHAFASNEAEPKSEASDVTRRVLNALENRLSVSRVGAAYVIEIAFESTNPDHAAQIANAVADAFIVDQLQAKYQTLGKTTDWLQNRLNELRVQASAAERAVVEYKSKHNIVDSGGRLINEQALSELQTALIKARADTVEAKARLDRVSQVVRGDDVDPSAAEVATVADALRNEIISRLRQQYLELSQREALFSTRLGDSHLAVVNLRNQMREIRRSITDELKRIAEADKSDYDIAKARESSLEKSLSATVTGSQTMNRAQVELRQLEAAAQSYRALYDNFQQHYMDAVQQQSFPMTEARVITRASPPSAKSSPKSFRILALATFGGLALGVGLAMLREITDRVFRTSSQVEAKLNTECIALVPIIEPRPKAAPANNETAAEPTGSRIIGPNEGLSRYVIDAPLSRFVESIRAVKVTADLSITDKSNKVIGITSSLPSEGKSTIAASLAQLSAHTGARVLLVDCDLRKPSLSEELTPNATSGLIDVITDAASLDEVIWSDASTQLSFLPVVVKSRLTDTTRILASDAMKRLFDRLRVKYDYVIVDLPPLAPVVDVRSTTHLVDCHLFVVEWGKTKIEVVEHALKTARNVYSNVLGIILNKVDFNRLAYYEGYRSAYYHSSYYGRYGYTE